MDATAVIALGALVVATVAAVTGIFNLRQGKRIEVHVDGKLDHAIKEVRLMRRLVVAQDRDATGDESQEVAAARAELEALTDYMPGDA